jgi:predicted metal-dependent hydrolase
VITFLVTVALVLVAFHLVAHGGRRVHASYRHHYAAGHRGINLYWSSVRGLWISIPGPFGTRIGRRL